MKRKSGMKILGCIAAFILLSHAASAQKTGIGTLAPTATLHVQNTASTAVRIVDGTQASGKVLTSDANGNANWQYTALQTILGTFPTTVVNFTDYGAGNPAVSKSLYTNASISLPPGKWMVSYGTTALIDLSAGVINSDNSLWLTLYLSDVSTGTTGPNSVDNLPLYTGPRGGGGAIGRGMNQAVLMGNVAIENKTAANKTYYLWAYQEKDALTAATPVTKSSGGNAYWVNVFNPPNNDRFFYAFPIQ
jgi:hypothetical protein